MSGVTSAIRNPVGTAKAILDSEAMSGTDAGIATMIHDVKPDEDPDATATNIVDSERTSE
jgi:hypothetical protein